MYSSVKLGRPETCQFEAFVQSLRQVVLVTTTKHGYLCKGPCFPDQNEFTDIYRYDYNVCNKFG